MKREIKIDDLVVYRGRYRQVVGFQQGDGTIGDAPTPVIVYRNPATGRDTYSRCADLRWSDYLTAYYPVGLLLSREECAVYAALPGTIGSGVPRATEHEAALRLLDAEALDQELDEAGQARFARCLAGYWPDPKHKGKSTRGPTEVWETAVALRAHRQEEAQNA